MMKISPIASAQINDYLKSKAKGLSLSKALENGAHETQIAKILYKHMPRVVRWALNEQKFLNFFSQHKSFLLKEVFSGKK